ncbi:prolyl 4-hydroxylase subunit alpha-2-like [Oppia nitens]|uniref:prolyl 4-hydroxylase subunit alpha-2-like n=1 Tax=Oppia nitens TaxID=1686743 RepID=UPI0023DCDF0F|nr:prolyl 4-hydroxylase subunit alpha-2-like [Oppia nitens]
MSQYIQYLSHPINIYLLIKRLATEWPQVDKLLDQPTHNKLRLRVNPIENNDLSEAAEGLQNLVNTYQLDIQALANGSVKFWSETDGREIIIQPSDDTHRLTAADCYLIGKQTLIEDYYENAIQWFNETIKRSDNSTTDMLFQSTVAKHMALAYYRLGDYNQIKRLNRSVESRLTCRYLDTTNRPLLRLTRVKVEQMFDKPDIVVFHDIISDREIDIMKQLASRQMARLMTLSKSTVSSGRLSDGSWLEDMDHEVIGRISRRIGALTGVSMNGSELYSVIKYRVGGYYVNHYDVSVYRPFIGELYGLNDRIATWVTYLGDVQSGGATVFPLLDVRIEPRKGSAVFWFNLKSSGLVDYNMMHCGCPVLAGQPKWIATKLMTYRSQQLHKPCLLDKHLFNYV